MVNNLSLRRVLTCCIIAATAAGFLWNSSQVLVNPSSNSTTKIISDLVVVSPTPSFSDVLPRSKVVVLIWHNSPFNGNDTAHNASVTIEEAKALIGCNELFVYCLSLDGLLRNARWTTHLGEESADVESGLGSLMNHHLSQLNDDDVLVFVHLDNNTYPLLSFTDRLPTVMIDQGYDMALSEPTWHAAAIAGYVAIRRSPIAKRFLDEWVAGGGANHTLTDHYTAPGVLDVVSNWTETPPVESILPWLFPRQSSASYQTRRPLAEFLVNHSDVERVNTMFLYNLSLATQVPIPRRKMVLLSAKFHPTNLFVQEVANFSALAASMNIFDHIYTYATFPTWIRQDPRWKSHLQFLNHSVVRRHRQLGADEGAARGGGFWFWKAPLLRHHLQELNNGDIIIYADADNSRPLSFLHSMALALRDHGGDLALVEISTLERRWTKADIYEEYCASGGMNQQNDATRQHSGGHIIIQKSFASLQFIADWETAVSNYHNINDEPSKLPNVADFKENRHDQSLLSVLLKCHYSQAYASRQFLSKYLRHTMYAYNLTLNALHPLGENQ